MTGQTSLIDGIDHHGVRWQIIPDHPNYLVSDDYRIRRRAGTKGCRHGREIKIEQVKTGWMSVRLRTGMRQVRINVNRLVAELFGGE